jgi:histidine ammonia-lyase
VNGLASGATGVRPALAQALVDALAAGVRPEVRRYGSIGVADLSANADLAHGALPDFALVAGEGLALLCHNAVSTGHAALGLADAVALLDTLDLAGALDFEAFGANVGALDPAVGTARPYAGLLATLEQVSGHLDGSYLRDAVPRNLQDPLCFRCLPQVHGAARDALGFALAQLAVELNAAQGNPLVAASRILAVGNFDALPLAAALDLARIALAPVLASACERSLKLLQRPLSGLPEGLAVREGSAEDGLAEFGIALQSLVAEARLLAQPVSFELASTTQAEGIEDRMTLAPLAARRLAEQVELGARAVAIELIVAAQAVDLRGASPLGRGTSRLYAEVRALVPPLRAGEPIPQDLDPVVELVRGRGRPHRP